MGSRAENKWQELKEDVGENRLALVFSAFFAAVLFILVFARQHIYPFGDYTLIYVDGDQYASLMRMVNDALSSGESFLYSFRMVLGGGAIATEGYYSLSPFNLLLFLFPNNLVAGIHFIACVKYISAALSFCALLNACHGDMVIEKSIFSACYAFIGYMSFFAWNLSWMDGVIVLPVVALGLLRLVRERKVLLYALALAFSVISNFYIGFMICIASVIIYLSAVFLAEDGAVPQAAGAASVPGAGNPTGHWVRERFRSLPRFIAMSLAGVGLSGFVLVPAVFGLPADRKEAFSDLFRSMHPTLRPSDMLSMLFTGRMCAQSANLPVIFSGILPLLFVIVFFFREDIPRRKKLAAFAVFFFMAFSFWNSMLNRIWHGMSENVWYNYRYSFVFSFFLLLLAFDALSSADRMRVSLYRVAVSLFVFCVWLYNETQEAFFAEDITRDAVLFVAGMVILWRMKKTRHTQKLRAVLLLLMCANVYRNAVTVMWPDVRESESATAFLREIHTAEEALSQVEDDGFYRLEKNYRIGRADAPLLRYYGVSNYASTENVELLETLRSFGIAHGWKWGYHTEHTPYATDALLGFRYLLGKEALPAEMPYTVQGQTGGITIHENKSALPLVMYSRTLPEEGPVALERLNAAYTAFRQDADARGGKRVFTAIGTADHAESALYYKSFTVGSDLANLPVYLYADYPVQTIYVYADEDTAVISHNPEQYVYNLGAYPAGTRVQVCLYVPQPVLLVEEDDPAEDGAQADGDLQTETAADTVHGPLTGGNAHQQAQNTDTLQSGTQALSGAGEGYAYRYFRLGECLLYAENTALAEAIAQNVQAHTKEVAVKGNTVRARIVADMAGYAVTTVPYDAGWQITVDGVSVLQERYLGQFLAVPVEAGEHVIEMRYIPRGFRAGVVLSLLAAVALVLYGVKRHKNDVNGFAGH